LLLVVHEHVEDGEQAGVGGSHWARVGVTRIAPSSSNAMFAGLARQHPTRTAKRSIGSGVGPTGPGSRRAAASWANPREQEVLDAIAALPTSRRWLRAIARELAGPGIMASNGRPFAAQTLALRLGWS
jgi:hypothetical protein